MWAQTQNPHLCHYANDPFCLWSYQDRHVWSRPKPEQDVQQGSYCCSSIFRKLSPTCLQGLRVSVTRPATSSGSNPVQRQMLLTILPSLCSVALELMVVIFALLSMCCQNLTTEVKIKIYHSDRATPLATAANSRKGGSLTFLAEWPGRVREHLITNSKKKSSD